MKGLRPRQVKAIDDLVAAYRAGHVAPLLRMPTGGGKTHTSVEMIRRSLTKGNRVWFLSHLKEINADTARRLKEDDVPFSYIQAGIVHDKRQPVQVVSVQTAARRLDRLDRPNLIIVDEAHLAIAATYQEIFRWAKAGPKFHEPGGAKLLHLSATPIRLDGRGMGEVSDLIVDTCSTQDLIDEGLLSPIRYYAPPPPDLSEVHSLAGEFNPGELAAAMDKPKITGSAVAEWMKVARYRPTIVFCVSIQHAEHVAEQFRLAGVRAVAVSGESDPIVRDAALADLQAGRVDVVCNCALWVAGVDAPSVSCIILLAPTQSLTKYLQSVGRGLRTYPGKDCCVILDHAGNIGRHGNPAEARAWSLNGAGKKKSSAPQEMPVKTCPSCFRTVMAAATDCLCGHHFVVKPRELEQVDGELHEVDLKAAKKQEKVAARIDQGRTQTLEALIALGHKRGMRRPELWARAVMTGRAVRDAKKAGLNRG